MKVNHIYGKSSERMKEIPDCSIRLIVTSPPYYTAKDYNHNDQIGLKNKSYEDYIDNLLVVWKECYRILRPNGKLCINTPIMPMKKEEMNTHYNRDYLNINNDIEFSILKNTNFYRYSLIIWDKGSTDQLMMGSYPFPPNFYILNTIEFINVFVKDGEPEKIASEIKEQSKLDKQQWREYISSIWRIKPEHKREHPAPFPPELPLRLIKLFSFVGDVIVDPFMGSGTTAVAALKTKRKYVGYEINKDYVTMAKKRIKRDTAQLQLLE